MGLFETIQSVKGNVTNQAPSPDISQADQRCKAAEDAVNEAIQNLGRMYFETNQNNTESEFYGQVSNVKECIEKAKLCYLYRLNLEDKTQCDSCGAIITADSAFCEKCGCKLSGGD